MIKAVNDYAVLQLFDIEAGGWSVVQIDLQTDKLSQQLAQLFKLQGGEA